MQDQRPLDFLSQALKGKNLTLVENKVVDALSQKDQSDETGELQTFSFPTPTWLTNLKSTYVADQDVHKLIYALQLDPTSNPLFKLRHGILFKND